jgi:hypothetical protein
MRENRPSGLMQGRELLVGLASVRFLPTLPRRQSQRPHPSRLVLRAARAAPAAVVAHLERSAKDVGPSHHSLQLSHAGRLLVVFGCAILSAGTSGLSQHRRAAASHCEEAGIQWNRLFHIGRLHHDRGVAGIARASANSKVQGLSRRMKTAPNQPLEPTSTLGTSAAELPRVPSALVAHL